MADESYIPLLNTVNATENAQISIVRTLGKSNDSFIV